LPADFLFVSESAANAMPFNAAANGNSATSRHLTPVVVFAFFNAIFFFDMLFLFTIDK
jgi:hypothetical protein